MDELLETINTVYHTEAVKACHRKAMSSAEKMQESFIGVAIVAPTRVKITKLSPKFEPQTFELLCARISSCGASCIVAVVYQPGSDDKTEAFYGEFARLLEYMASFASPFFITGDLNVQFDRPSEPPTVRVNDILSS